MFTKRQNGDTIIEVILAVALFSSVSVGATALMNSGLAMAQSSLEVTLVRQQVDAQAELLRFVHSQSADGKEPYHSLWNSLKSGGSLVDSPQQLLDIDQCPENIDNHSFILALQEGELASSDHYVPAETYAKTDGANAYGISIQLTDVNGGNAYDAYIQGCWQGPGSTRPKTIGTIVRLYDAAS